MKEITIKSKIDFRSPIENDLNLGTSFNTQKFSNYLHDEMNIRGTLTKRELYKIVSLESGVSQSTISRVLLYNGNLRIGNILKLCRWMGVPITEFIES